MQKKIILAGIFIMWLAGPGIYAQHKRQASLEKESKEYFNQKEYSKALQGYRQLLNSFPKDPWYNYYTGVCLTELKQDPSVAIYRLKTASLGKDIPADVYFYLGRASYQAGLYREAIDYFNRFRNRAGTSESKSYHVDKWITQCRMYINNPQGSASGEAESTSAAQATGYQQVANRALEYQHKADSVRLLIYQKENRMRSAVDNEREQMRKDIARLHDQEEQYQQKADKNFRLARKYEREGHMNTTVTAQDYQSNPAETQVLAPKTRLKGEGASPFLELTGDDFYRQPEFRRIFAPEDVQLLDDYHELNIRGNQYMKEALTIEREIEDQQMIINTSTGGKTRKRAQQKVNNLEEQKMQKRLKAVGYFQEANDGEYALNKRYIESLELHPVQDAARKKQGEAYKEEAVLSYNKALILRKKAANYLNYSSKYDLLMEANAYELSALDAQRKAMATYAGLIPAGTETDLVHASVIPPKTASVPRKTDRLVAVTKPEMKGKKKESPNGGRGVTEEKTAGVKTVGKKEMSPAEKKAAHEKMLSRYTFGFEMTDSTVYPSVADIPDVNAMPPGVNYRIQVGVFRNTPDISYFNGMYPMVSEKIPDKKLVRFYAGLFRTYGQASAVLLDLREKGYKDAIIVGFYNGKKASVSRIRWLEDQEPYTNIRPAPVRQQQITASTGKQASRLSMHQENDLLFRVQLGVFREPLPREKLQELEKFTEKNYVVIRTRNNQGLYVYAIGNFTTFEEAKTFRNKLTESGVSGCFVTAYKKGVRVPLSEIEGI